MAETMMILSVVAFLLAGVLGTASVVLWIQFDIPEIMGDLNRKPAKRSGSRRRERGKSGKRDRTEWLDDPEDIMIIHTNEVIRKGEEEA